MARKSVPQTLHGNKTPTGERLRYLLDYNPVTGLFRWKVSTSNRVEVGAVAGSKTGDYAYIGVDGTAYLAHRLIWIWVHNVDPEEYIDHRNGNKRDNRLENLRQATVSQNMCNQKVSAICTTGYKGVSLIGRTGRYRATIGINSKTKHLGSFDTAQEAHEAYCAAAALLHGEFMRVK